MAIDRNPLERFSTFNYIWFLDIAAPGEVRTAAYKNRQGRILRSGGIANTYSPGMLTEDEKNLGVKGEYFIDNVKTEAYVSPNPYSGIANATRVNFEVIEPYSIGLFLQTLQLAAVEAGYKNYLDAPFVLGVEFTGFDKNGNLGSGGRRVMLIKLTRVNFRIDAAGSVYEVQAIPWNHQALLDQNDRIPVNISIKGDTVEEILTSLEETPEIGFGEGQVDTGLAAAAGISPDDAGKRSLIGELTKHETEQLKEKAGSENITPTQYEILFPVDPADPGTKNDFARYKIAENFLDLGNQDHSLPDAVFDRLNALFERRKIEISENGRVYQFRTGTKIETIIEEVILTSEWASKILELKPDNEGFIEWFKIITFVDFLEGEQDRFGSMPKKFTFMVYPYRIHASVLAPTSQNINYNANVRNAVRGYDYIYTGENTDIIDFNIQIDYAWIQALPNLTQVSQALTDQQQRIWIQQEATAIMNQGVDPGLAIGAAEKIVRLTPERASTSNLFSNHGGSNIDDERTRTARAFNDAIVNSNADLIRLNLVIWGDPYYLADSDYGGFIAKRSRPNIDSSGTLDYLRSEVDVLVRFSGAVDYKNNLLTPNVARQFSGVYRVIRVNSSFEGGQFRQELQMIRRRNQDDATIDNTLSRLEAASQGQTESFERPSTTGVNVGDLGFFLRQADETEQLFNIFGQIRLQDLVNGLNMSPFELISQLSNFSQLFDQARQIKSAVGNLGSLSSNLNLKNINAQSIQQLTSQLTNAQDFFQQAFSQVDVSSITQSLNQLQSGSSGPNPLTQISGTLAQLKSAKSLTDVTTIVNTLGSQGANVPISSPLPSLASVIRPRPQSQNPVGTQLISTPDGGFRRISTGGR